MILDMAGTMGVVTEMRMKMMTENQAVLVAMEVMTMTLEAYVVVMGSRLFS